MTLLDASAKLKENGHPVRPATVATATTATTTGGRCCTRSAAPSSRRTAQKVTLASDETLAAIKYGVELYNKG